MFTQFTITCFSSVYTIYIRFHLSVRSNINIKWTFVHCRLHYCHFFFGAWSSKTDIFMMLRPNERKGKRKTRTKFFSFFLSLSFSFSSEYFSSSVAFLWFRLCSKLVTGLRKILFTYYLTSFLSNSISFCIFAVKLYDFFVFM